MNRHRRLGVLAIVTALVATGICGLLVVRVRERALVRPNGTALEAVIADVEAGRRTTPLIGEPAPGGDVTVTFLAKGAGGLPPRIVSDVTGWGEHVDGTFDFGAGTMTRVGRTDWYVLRAAVAPGARIEYLVASGTTDYRIDPHNPRQPAGFGTGGPPASEFVTPGYLPPQEFVDPPVAPAGRTAETTIESPALGGHRRAIVYTPPGYRRDAACPVAVFHNGLAVAQMGEAPRVLDWLIARRDIEPIVAVFVDSHRDGDDYERMSSSMRVFFTRDLPAWLASRDGVATTASGRAIVAISYGAKDAVDAATSAPEAFGRLGLLIPGRRLGPTDIEAFAGRRHHRLRVAILAGRYDRANVATARHVRDALAASGHAVDYTEVPEGHSPRTWRNHLRRVLVSLFGPGSPR